jgi:uncharacterized protein YbcI
MQQELKSRIVNAVTAFERNQMSVTPESVTVELEERSLVVVMHGVTSEAERNYARNPESRELLDRFYRELFDATKAELESSIERILDKQVAGSSLSVDSESASAVLMFRLSPPEENRNETNQA